jgi:uridine kinase
VTRTAHLIGIAGGSASGKTTLARRVEALLPPGSVATLSFDAWYRDLRHLPIEERSRLSFDAPESLDEAGLLEALRALRGGRPAQAPVYDFATHSRTGDWVEVEPRPLVVVDGILLLHWPALREILDERVFVGLDDAERLRRRVERDGRERGRSAASVHAQWHGTVLPAQHLWVEPSRAHADHLLQSDDEAERWLRDGKARWMAAIERWGMSLSGGADGRGPGAG